MEGKVINQYILALIANIPSLSCGILVGWMSPMVPLLQSDTGPASSPFSDRDVMWLAGSMTLGALFAVPLYGYAANRFGRKPGVWFLSLFQFITWVIKLSTVNPAALIAARGISGIAAAGVFLVVPLYVKEISDDSVRGVLGTFVIFISNVGTIVVFALGDLLSYYTNHWVYLAIPVAHMALFVKVPETPSFLVKMGKEEEARKALAFLKSVDVDSKIVTTEIENIKRQNENIQAKTDVSFRRIVRDPGTLRAFIICIVLFSTQTLCGSFAVVTFSSTIFARAGAGIPPNMQALVVGFVQVAGSVLAVAVVERTGRKMLMTISCCVTCACMCTLGVWFTLLDRGVLMPGWLPVLAAALCIFAVGGGIGPVPFVVMSEIFSFQTRDKLSTLVMALCWANDSIVLFSFRPMCTLVGTGPVFFSFTTILLMASIFCILCLPETKNRSVEDIQGGLRRKFFKF